MTLLNYYMMDNARQDEFILIGNATNTTDI